VPLPIVPIPACDKKHSVPLIRHVFAPTFPIPWIGLYLLTP
jgi:hypothetical protein